MERERERKKREGKRPTGYSRTLNDFHNNRFHLYPNFSAHTPSYANSSLVISSQSGVFASPPSHGTPVTLPSADESTTFKPASSQPSQAVQTRHSHPPEYYFGPLPSSARLFRFCFKASSRQTSASRNCSVLLDNPAKPICRNEDRGQV